ncbi:hypothetical protein C8Q73DRAFT_776637 [Cubamyces lactineus]|nr:hypothetical protein C8Q73DRAFT_776637 [Cubamyces lactineus]
MARGRKTTAITVACPICGKEYNKNGIGSHKVACQRRADTERAAQAQYAAVQQATAGGSRAQGLVIPPPPSSPGLRGAPSSAGSSPGPDNVDNELVIEQDRGGATHYRGPSVEDLPEPEEVHPAPRDEDQAAPPSPARASPSPSTNTLRLPTFRAPTGPDLPSNDLRVDDFLTISHPHAATPPIHKHFDDFTRTPPPISPTKLNNTPWHPFKSREDFEFAEFVLKAALNQGEVDALLALIDRVAGGRSALSFRSYGDLKDAWDAASRVAPAFMKHKVTVPYKKEDRTYTMYCRPLFEWSLGLLKDPLLASKFVWHAQRLYKYNGRTWERFVDEPNTADGWWKVEDALPEDGSPLMYALYADKTRLSSFGTQKGYPIIARITNLPSDIRNGEEYGGGQVVGFLPIVEDENEEGKKGFTTYKRIIWHESFWILLETIAKYGKTGYRFTCGDDVTRILYPIVLILVADYEEQAMMSLNRGPKGLSPCPVCLVPQDKQMVLGLQPEHPYRDAEPIQALLDNADLTKRQLDEALKPMGLRPVENVFWKLPHCNVYRALSWDRLHAYHGGLFSDHLFEEFQQIVKAMGREAVIEINQQFDDIPSWPNLNHFDAVVSVNFTDGQKYEDISKSIVHASHSVFRKAKSKQGYMLLKCLRRYIVLDILAGLEVHMESTLRLYANELVKYSQTIKEYSDAFPGKNWNFPKCHTHQHIVDDVMEKGVTKNFNTKPFEKMHGIIKGIYQDQTNFKDVEAQIARIEHQVSVARFMRSRINALDEAVNKRLTPKEPKADSFQFAHVHLGAPTQGTTTISDIETTHATEPDGRAPQWVKIQSNDVITEMRYIRVDYESRVTWQMYTDHLRCNPSFHGAPRYDHVMYKINDTKIGFAQLCFVFVCTFMDTRQPLALVHCLDVVQARQTVDQDLGLCRVRRSRSNQNSYRFIPVTSIIRGALITEDALKSNDFFVIDSVDGDMFVRL